jgi:hypothetical protein
MQVLPEPPPEEVDFPTAIEMLWPFGALLSDKSRTLFLKQSRIFFSRHPPGPSLSFISRPLSRLKSLAIACDCLELFIIHDLAALIAVIWNSPHIGEGDIPLAQLEFRAPLDGGPADDRLFFSAQICLYLLLEPFIPMLPVHARPLYSRFHADVEERLGSFPESGLALACAEHTKRHVATVTELVRLLAGDLGESVPELIAIDKLARIPELRATRLAIDYFPLPGAKELTEKTKSETPIDERARGTTA